MQYDTLSTTWGDVTTSVDKENNIIYGQVFHLSIFAVMEPIPHANIDVDPDTLNLGSKGKWITSYIELPEGYAVTDIDLSTIMLNGTIQVYASAPTCIGDYDTDGIQDLMVKFDRAAVQQYILDNVPIEAKFVTATLTVTGRLNDGTLFQGSDTIKITMPGNYWKIIRLEKLGKA
jgi:hypothetical protein